MTVSYTTIFFKSEVLYLAIKQEWKIVQLLQKICLTINAPLILQVRDIIFFKWEKHFMGPFEGFLEELESSSKNLE